jgi:hypothetical protein
MLLIATIAAILIFDVLVIYVGHKIFIRCIFTKPDNRKGYE